MPRVSAAHELEIKDRIVQAALGVFADKGFYRATMQDIVRESGLSVGAIYTYFKSKDELFLAGCDLSTGQGIGELGTRLVAGRTLVDRIAISVGYFLDGVDDVGESPGIARFLVQAWAGADNAPVVREMLIRRREQIATVGQILIQEGVTAGALPTWMDVEGLAFGISALFDGILLMRIEEGDGYRRATAERRLRAVIEPILAVPRDAVRHALPDVPARPHPLIGSRLA